MSNKRSNRERILQCAKELFYSVGYQATSVDDIVVKCGVAKSNFYYHFDSKEQLAFEVLQQRIEEYEALMLCSLQNAEYAPTERLDRFLHSIREAQSNVQKMAGCPFGNFAAALPTAEHNERNERFRQRLSQLFHIMEMAVRECLADGIEHGEFRADIPPSEMAAFVIATIQGLMILTKTHQDTAPLISGFALVQKLLRT